MPTRASGPGTYTVTITPDGPGRGLGSPETFNVGRFVRGGDAQQFHGRSDGSQLQVSYSIANAAAAPFNIDIYTSPDGVTPDQLLMSYPVTGSDLTETTSNTVSFPAAFDDIASNYHLIAVSDANGVIPTARPPNAGGIRRRNLRRRERDGESAAEHPVRLRQQRERRSHKRRRYGQYLRRPTDSKPNSVVFDNGTPFSIGSTITGIHVRGEAGNDSFGGRIPTSPCRSGSMAATALIRSPAAREIM